MTHAPLGEVLLATTTQFTAQCIEVPRPELVSSLPDPPPFGALVRIVLTPSPPSLGDSGSPLLGQGVIDDFDPFESDPAPITDDAPTALFGLVFHAETGAIEPGRPLSALGLTEDELLREQPQIYELLATRFSAALIGWTDADGRFRASLPPRPPRPHARVLTATPADEKLIASDLGWLRGLVRGERVPTGIADELLIAALRRLWSASGEGEAFALRAGKELSRLLAADYERLRTILERLVGE